ncbi:hypothetical protein [Streptomyces sp. NPDC051992]|uniref:hypothetical protein n=1 Tax=Streptomyces sp. NPDC051992 TaxID=3161012 RepID=UPI0034484DEE
MLLLLYAQWPAVISRFTIDHIEETGRAVVSASAQSQSGFPHPSTWPCHQVAVRRSYAALDQTGSFWLFSGGQPGRPISAWAMGERLHKLGIRLSETRSTALFQLASELPAAVLARTLGIDTTVAIK